MSAPLAVATGLAVDPAVRLPLAPARPLDGRSLALSVGGALLVLLALLSTQLARQERPAAAPPALEFVLAPAPPALPPLTEASPVPPAPAAEVVAEPPSPAPVATAPPPMAEPITPTLALPTQAPLPVLPMPMPQPPLAHLTPRRVAAKPAPRPPAPHPPAPHLDAAAPMTAPAQASSAHAVEPAPAAAAGALAAFQSAMHRAVQASLIYPPAARMAGQSGDVHVAFDFEDGRVSNPVATGGSGLPLLDRAAVETVAKARCPQPPPELAHQLLHMTVLVQFTPDRDE